MQHVLQYNPKENVESFSNISFKQNLVEVIIQNFLLLPISMETNLGISLKLNKLC